MTKKLNRGIAIVGAGMSRFGAHPGVLGRDLFVTAYREMLASVDKGVDPKEIEALYVGNFSSAQFQKQAHIAPILADWTGLAPRPATRVEGACASSGLALREGLLAIASGAYDIVLVGGVEKMTELPTAQVTDALATAADMTYEIPAGFTFPGLFAAMATAYMHRYGAAEEDLMRIGIKNHANGARNELAQFGATIRQIMDGKIARAEAKGYPAPTWSDELDFLHDDRSNPMIASPLRLFDCSPVSDGAATLLLASEELAHRFTDDPIWIAGSGQASDVAMHDRDDFTRLCAAQEAARQAYAMAGVTPEDIDFAEVHDCFTIAELIAIEDLGFYPPGQGWHASSEGQTSLDGPRPINPSGGLKSKGHPVGATGAGQAVEVWKQLRGRAGERQVPGDPRLGLTHNVGGTGQTAAVHIFERR